MDDTLLQMIQILKRKQKTLVAYQENTAFMLQPEDVFYFDYIEALQDAVLQIEIHELQ